MCVHCLDRRQQHYPVAYISPHSLRLANADKLVSAASVAAAAACAPAAACTAVTAAAVSTLQVCPTAAPSPMCAPRAASSRRLVVAGRAVATRHKHTQPAAAAAALGRTCSCSSSGRRCVPMQQQLAAWVAVWCVQVLVGAVGALLSSSASATATLGVCYSQQCPVLQPAQAC
jgi:hypothetical protein